MDKPVVKELIQHELTPANISTELTRILQDEAYLKEMKEGYATLKDGLQQGGNASLKAAQLIIDYTLPPDDKLNNNNNQGH